VVEPMPVRAGDVIRIGNGRRAGAAHPRATATLRKLLVRRIDWLRSKIESPMCRTIALSHGRRKGWFHPRVSRRSGSRVLRGYLHYFVGTVSWLGPGRGRGHTRQRRCTTPSSR
jgi:hypothetical protein